MTDFAQLNETTQLGTDRIFTSPAALALYRNLLATCEQALGAPKILGNLHLVEQQVVASPVAQVDFTSGLAGTTREEHWLQLINVVPATNAVNLLMRMDTNGGASFDAGATDYAYATDGIRTDAAVSTNNSAGANAITLCNTTISNSAPAGGYNGWIKLMSLKATDRHKMINWLSNFPATTAIFTVCTGHGNSLSATLRDAAVDAVRLLMSSGNIASGTFRLWAHNQQGGL